MRLHPVHCPRSANGDPGGRPGARCLPADFPRWDYQRLRSGPSGLFVVSTVPSNGKPAWVAVFNQHGALRWWFRPSTIAYDAQVLADGTFVWGRGFGDGYGIDPRSAAEIHSADGKLISLVRTPGSITDVHEFEEAPNGHHFLDSYVPHPAVDLSPYGGPRRAHVAFPRIQELDRHGHTVWAWSSLGRIGLDESERWWNHSILLNAHRVNGKPTYDAVHLNSIEPWGDSQVVISTRHTDAVYGISRRTGDILWKLGGTRTGKSLRVIGDPYGRMPFAGQHDARVNGHVLSVFDNETHRSNRPRAAFYRLDLAARTATFIRALHEPKVTSSHCCGSVRAYGDGWLVDWGDNRWITGFNRQGKIAFRLHLASSTYRAVPVPAGAVTDAELTQGLKIMAPGQR